MLDYEYGYLLSLPFALLQIAIKLLICDMLQVSTLLKRQ